MFLLSKKMSIIYAKGVFVQSDQFYKETKKLRIVSIDPETDDCQASVLATSLNAVVNIRVQLRDSRSFRALP